MSDRKYRQSGYQDDDRSRRPRQDGQGPRKPQTPYDPRIPRDPKVPNLPGFLNVFRCVRCGHQESTDVGALSKCGKCGVDLHACIHCASFDAGAVYECMEPIPARETQPLGRGFVRGVPTVAVVISRADHEARFLPEEPEIFLDDRDLHVGIER